MVPHVSATWPVYRVLDETALIRVALGASHPIGARFAAQILRYPAFCRKRNMGAARETVFERKSLASDQTAITVGSESLLIPIVTMAVFVRVERIEKPVVRWYDPLCDEILCAAARKSVVYR